MPHNNDDQQIIFDLFQLVKILNHEISSLKSQKCDKKLKEQEEEKIKEEAETKVEVKAKLNKDLDGGILPDSFLYGTTILNEANQVNLIKGWLKNNNSISTLIYQGRIHGYNADAFHNCWFFVLLGLL